MPVDQSLVGREFPPTQPFRVSAEKVREFRAATWAIDQAIPPTFPIVMAPTDPRVIYVGSQHVWKSTNEGQSWTKISRTLTVIVAPLRQIRYRTGKTCACR